MTRNLHLSILILLTLILETFTQLYDIKIKENTAENTFIYDLNAFDHHGSDPNKHKQFTLLSSQNSKINSLFLLKRNGRLHTSKLIDREQICSQIDECCHSKDPCTISILVAVSSQSMITPSTFECRIQIEDENDNSPTFLQNKLTIPIKEFANVGSSFPLPLAIDLDTEKFVIKKYILVEQQSFPPTFSLEQQRPNSNLYLQIIQKLDREKRSNYELTLLAIDGGSPPKTGKLLIDIKVLDVNDNAPRLLRSNYVANQKESEFLTRPLLTIEAKDDDENENAELFFKIVNENPLQIDNNKYFRVEHGTGKIFLNQPLDYEKQEKHRFFVDVSNKDVNIETATATVLVNVENLNDEKPEISINYLNMDRNNAEIQENDVQTKFIALATVSDKDKGVGGQVSCKLINFYDTFEIQVKDLSRFPNQYIIQTKVALDREKNAFYKVIMECEDKGNPVLKTKKEINIKVNDLNDNSPVIKMDENISVKENCQKGTIITKIQAIDDDEGQNGMLHFSISDSEDQTLRLLEIDTITGELRTKDLIDREKDIKPITELPVVLTVSDKGKPQQSSIKRFKVKIEDENDNPPHFSNDLILFYVTENQEPRYTLGEIPVMDKDDETHLRVTLAPAPDHYSSPFILFKRENTYFLNTTRSLDWEKEKSFSLKVIASDGYGYKSHTVTAEIRVNIRDENDNSPIIIFPIQKNFTIPKLSFYEKIGFTILTVSAVDKDSPQTNNGKISFQMFDSKDLFMIDSTTGAIRTSRLMSRLDLGRCEVKVVVRDFGTPPRESVINLFIEVDDSKSQSSNEGFKDNEDNLRTPLNNYLWTKESFLVISLIILMLFLLICVFMILYLRHIRGLFSVLPDIFAACRRVSKSRKFSKSEYVGKTESQVPFEHNLRNSPLNIQQTNNFHNDKSTIPYYLNQYDPSLNKSNFSLEHQLPVNLYRHYETMKYQQYSTANQENNIIPNSSTYNYEKLFSSPSTSQTLGLTKIPGNNSNNFNKFYDSTVNNIQNTVDNKLPICRRIINNIETSPLVFPSNSKDSSNEQFSSDPCQKFDDAERFIVDHSVTNTPDLRSHGRPNDKIDTYAITYPVEQSTFV